MAKSTPKNKSRYYIGDTVSAHGHGEGVVVHVSDRAETEKNRPLVYSVELKNGEVRHFTADQLS